MATDIIMMSLRKFSEFLSGKLKKYSLVIDINKVHYVLQIALNLHQPYLTASAFPSTWNCSITQLPSCHPLNNTKPTWSVAPCTKRRNYRLYKHGQVADKKPQEKSTKRLPDIQFFSSLFLFRFVLNSWFLSYCWWFPRFLLAGVCLLGS